MSSTLISLGTAAALATGAPNPHLAARGPRLPLLTMRAAEPAPSESVAPAPAPAPASAPDPAEALAPAPAAPAQPAPAPAAEPAPAPTVVLQPAPSAAPQPAEPAAEPPPSRSGIGLLITGGTMMGVGAISLLFVAVPASIVRDVAQGRADRDDALAFTSRQNRYARARRADDTMEAAFWVGAPLLAGGMALLIAGAVIRANTKARARAREQARVAATPGGVSVRF